MKKRRIHHAVVTTEGDHVVLVERGEGGSRSIMTPAQARATSAALLAAAERIDPTPPAPDYSEPECVNPRHVGPAVRAPKTGSEIEEGTHVVGPTCGRSR